MNISIEATKHREIENFSKIWKPKGLGIASPQIGLQSSVPFSSKKKPSEQFSLLLKESLPGSVVLSDMFGKGVSGDDVLSIWVHANVGAKFGVNTALLTNAIISDIWQVLTDWQHPISKESDGLTPLTGTEAVS